jgi:hypothetical protein
MRIRSYHWQSLLAVLLTTVAPVSRAIAQAVGSVSAVNPSTTGQPPAASPRALNIGANVVHKERIRTTSEGSVQISFPDRTTINVGRNSDLVIDEFVYDPSAGTGRLAASLSKGVLRFVGGQVSHNGDAQIRTPASTIGIRGGVGTIAYAPDVAVFQSAAGGTAGCPGALVVNHFGTMVVRNNVSAVTIRRSGYAVCVTGPNQPIPEPFPISDAVLKQVMALMTSGPGQRGGAVILPTDQMAARLGLEIARLPNLNNAPGSNPLDRSGIVQGGDNLAKNQAQAQQNESAELPPDEEPCYECCGPDFCGPFD